uniref:Uncharacterized protein n=1 Tax=Ciona savignyi TaxID=51511 RepID=H2ZP58_CIOSA
ASALSPGATIYDDDNIVQIAKENIDQLEGKKEKLIFKRSDEDTSVGQISFGEGSLKTSDEEISLSEEDNDTVEGEDEQPNVAIQEEIANITYEIDVKQELVHKVEAMQRKMVAMDKQFKEKLQLLSEQIKSTELERDKVLQSIDIKSSVDKEKENTIRIKYQKQLEQLKKNLTKLQQEQKNHNQLIREQSKQTIQLKQLKIELQEMKSTK